MSTQDEIALLKKLTVRRGTAKASITRVENFVKAMTDNTVLEEISVRLEILEKAFIDFKDEDNNICQIPGGKSEMDLVEQKYCELKIALRQAYKKHNTAFNSLQGQLQESMMKFAEQQKGFFENLNESFVEHQNHAVNEVRLPQLHVPVFDGRDYIKFQAFKDAFEAAIHSRDMPETNKFRYLMSYLDHDAKDLLSHIPVTSANYGAAWKKLCDRYDKKKFLCTKYIKRFMDISPVHQSNCKSLRQLVNVSDEVIRGLDAVGGDAKSRDVWIVHMLVQKLDLETKTAWAQQTINQEFPKFSDLIEFLNSRCDALESVEESGRKPSPQNAKIKSFVVSNPNKSTVKCIICNQTHFLMSCKVFQNMEVSARRDVINKQGLCYNCLSTSHRVTQCKSKFTCRKCHSRHHTLLHPPSTDNTDSNYNSSFPSSQIEPVPQATKPIVYQANGQSASHSNIGVHTVTCNQFQSILPTALVRVQAKNDTFIECRVLLDSASHTTFISESCMQKLCLARQNARFSISGISATGVETKGYTALNLTSRKDSHSSIQTDALILDNISSLSTLNCKVALAEDLDFLADPKYYSPGRIDILLGVDKTFEVFLPEFLSTPGGGPMAINSIFGWVIVGKPVNLKSSETIANFNTILTSNDDDEHAVRNIDRTLRQFWECENLQTTPLMSKEEKLCEAYYTATTQRDPNTKRYVVSLPFNSHKSELGSSYNLALQRLFSMERKMARNSEFKNQYHNFMNEYEQLGHMKEVTDQDRVSEKFYLPHHAVLKMDSQTTKLRVVFDGSAHSSFKRSLNQCLMTGPTIQATLWELLINFRFHRIALTADIEKMYRQVLVHSSDHTFQRILWRYNPKDPVKEYKLQTVTYGVSAAPFLAIRSLHQVAIDNSVKHPTTSKIIKSSFYVDDLLTGFSNENEAELFKAEVIHVLRSSGFELRKWRSNIPNLCHNNGDTDAVNSLNLKSEDHSIKILGVLWNPKLDVFEFKIDLPEIALTKRTLLSEASRVFDPHGWLSPSIVLMKILFQKLWLRKLEWDDPLPNDLERVWFQLRSELKLFENLQIPRFVDAKGNITTQIHGFSDSSESAFAAAVYMRSISSDGKVTVRLIAAKTRVSPLKQLSLPRLELCGASLLANLLHQIRNILPESKHMYAWTDSNDVLGWLAEQPRQFNTYVANRASEIHTLIPDVQWRHVKGKDNPVDCASRGIMPSKLVQFEKWWTGPPWLSLQEDFWPQGSVKPSTQLERRKRDIQCFTHSTNTTIFEDLLSRFSSWPKIRRIVAYCLRFVHNSTSNNKFNKNTGTLSVDERKLSEIYFIKWSQNSSFGDEIKNLKRQGALKIKSGLQQLSPFIDGTGVLRVGGRLDHSQLPFNQKHPAILHHKCALTKLIVNHYHERYFHPGPNLTVKLLQQQYWIVHGRSMIRYELSKCTNCTRQRAKLSKQLMGNLPAPRVTPDFAFHKVGIDYAGPIEIKSKQGRGAQIIKIFISVFVCMCTKALHLEIVNDLTTDAFLAALKRFAGRRGWPSDIYSDNGGNFIGAKRKMSEIYNLVLNNSHNSIISEYLSEFQVNWHFIPATASHFGGLWEGAVKSMKSHLIRVTMGARLTSDELNTLLIQIEALLNSRPLCPKDVNDPTSLDVLTPGHFLIFRPITLMPEPSYENVPDNRLSRWEQVAKRLQSFQSRFCNEYINTLQQRYKWTSSCQNLKPDDLVLVKNDSTASHNWIMARVIQCHYGNDNKVRAVTLRTARSVINRPIHKLCRMPLN